MTGRYCPECYGQIIKRACPRCGRTIHVCLICSQVFVEKETLRDLPDKLIVHESKYHPESDQP